MNASSVYKRSIQGFVHCGEETVLKSGGTGFQSFVSSARHGRGEEGMTGIEWSLKGYSERNLLGSGLIN